MISQRLVQGYLAVLLASLPAILSLALPVVPAPSSKYPLSNSTVFNNTWTDGTMTFGLDLVPAKAANTSAANNDTSPFINAKWDTGIIFPNANYNETDMHAAMKCLEDWFCRPYRYEVVGQTISRCSINNMVAYVCNYDEQGSVTYSPNACWLDEMKMTYQFMRDSPNNPTHHGLGWAHDPEMKLTYGWGVWGQKVCDNLYDWHSIQFELTCREDRCVQTHGSWGPSGAAGERFDLQTEVFSIQKETLDAPLHMQHPGRGRPLTGEENRPRSGHDRAGFLWD